MRTALFWDGVALTATDQATEQSIRVSPSSLLHYRYQSTVIDPTGVLVYDQTVEGLAILDRAGLVMADLPGEWPAPAVHSFAQVAGIPVHVAIDAHPQRTRTVLAARAPGWRRLTGTPPPPPARWRKPLAIALGVAAVAAMAYLISTGAWYVWRAFSTFGRILVDLIEVKWLIFLFSPLLVFLAPIRARLTRRHLRKGTIITSTGGLHLKISSGVLHINRGPQTLTTIAVARRPEPCTITLLLYRYEDTAGLFVLTPTGRPLHHLPGPWSPDHVNRFATQHNLPLELRTLQHSEYLSLTTQSTDATP